jgi:SAM-dependent methyltransferase
MAESLDYSLIAHLYDLIVHSTFDIPFFLNEARKTNGEILELMAGTGRISLPLVEAGMHLTCVDNSPKMLNILREKLESQWLTTTVILMDVRELALPRLYDQIILPFHSFAELVTPSDQRETMSGVYRHLADGGQFICTLHNPKIRLKSVDGQLRLWGRFPLAEKEGTLLLWGLENFNSDDYIISGLEFFEAYDQRGVMRSRSFLEFQFGLLEKDEFEDLAISTGFTIEALYGDYTYTAYNDETSPYMIWILRK